MSGDEKNHHCRIGKVTLKPRAQVLQKQELFPRAPGRTRGLFVEALRAMDSSSEQGNPPVVGFFGIAFRDGRVCVNSRMNEEPTDEVLNSVNWRHLTMLFEDMATDIRNFQNYHQMTPFDLVDEESPVILGDED